MTAGTVVGSSPKSSRWYSSCSKSRPVPRIDSTLASGLGPRRCMVAWAAPFLLDDAPPAACPPLGPVRLSAVAVVCCVFPVPVPVVVPAPGVAKPPRPRVPELSMPPEVGVPRPPRPPTAPAPKPERGPVPEVPREPGVAAPAAPDPAGDMPAGAGGMAP